MHKSQNDLQFGMKGVQKCFSTVFFSFSFSQVGDFPERDPFEDDEI
jgi:hypothetical protein